MTVRISNRSLAQRSPLRYLLTSTASDGASFEGSRSLRFQREQIIACATEEHKERVNGVAARLRYFHDRKERYEIYHATTSTTRRTKLNRRKVSGYQRREQCHGS